jgi:hypothetical protein
MLEWCQDADVLSFQIPTIWAKKSTWGIPADPHIRGAS